MQVEEYIRLDGRYVKVHRDSQFDHVGQAYVYEGKVYLYYGEIEGNDEDLRPGFYLKDGEVILIEYEDGEGPTEEEIVKRKTISKEDLLKNIKSLPKEETITPTRSKKARGSNRRNSVRRSTKDTPIHYEIYPEDDDMVRLLKETINEKGITMQDIYDRSENNNAGYNLYYGLGERHSISYASFKKWADILGMEVVITLKEKTE